MYVSEFIGTLLLVSAVAFAKSPLYVVAAFCLAITIGSDINPAVTIFKLVAGKVSKMNTVYLISAQVLAGACVGLLYSMR